MSYSLDLPVSYHQQDTDYYCGAACAQMVLDQIGAGLLDQTPLYNDNHNHSTIESGWATAPDGLLWTLNNRRPPKFTNSFALFALSNVDSISRKIAWTLHNYKVAAVALVFGSDHWIVVRGVDLSAAPASSADTTYTIDALMVNNPWPPVPQGIPPPPPHDSTDGCGTGGVRGVLDEHITYSAWQSTYMTGVPDGHWKGTFVAVCDPDQPPTSLGEQPNFPRRPNTTGMISEDNAQSQAVDGLRTFGLYEKKFWSNHLSASKPGKPFLVQRLDRQDSFYYIVPMQTKSGVSSVLARVDALYGNYQQAVRASEPASESLNQLKFESESFVDKLSTDRIDLGGEMGLLKIRRNGYVSYPTLVWKPCRESLSPFYPFHMIVVGNQRVFVRVDGQVYTELHDDIRGF
jgi:hypothetical protein